MCNNNNNKNVIHNTNAKYKNEFNEIATTPATTTQKLQFSPIKFSDGGGAAKFSQKFIFFCYIFSSSVASFCINIILYFYYCCCCLFKFPIRVLHRFIRFKFRFFLFYFCQTINIFLLTFFLSSIAM